MLHRDPLVSFEPFAMDRLTDLVDQSLIVDVAVTSKPEPVVESLVEILAPAERASPTLHAASMPLSLARGFQDGLWTTGRPVGFTSPSPAPRPPFPPRLQNATRKSPSIDPIPTQ